MRRRIPAVLFALACGLAPAYSVLTAAEVQTLVEQVPEGARINFLPRSSSVSNPDKKLLREKLKPLLTTQPPTKVKIYAWGDKANDTPNVKAGDRDNATQVELAENRGQAIRETLQGLGAQSVEMINVARGDADLKIPVKEPQFSKVYVVLEKPETR